MDIIILSLIVFVAYGIGATTGFGGSILALTLAAHFFPLGDMVAIVVPLNVTATLYLALRYHKHTDIRLLFRYILPFTALGLPVGLVIFNMVETNHLKLPFGLFVSSLALWELIRHVRSNGNGNKTTTPLWLLAGGTIHGLWASGGPLIVYWVGRNLTDKHRFRATLIGMWVLLDASMLVSHICTGKIDMRTGMDSLCLLPALAVATACGELLHGKLNEFAFRLVVFTVLFLAGASVVFHEI